MSAKVVKLDNRVQAPTPRAPIHPKKGHIRIDRVAVTFGRGANQHIAVAETSLDIVPGEFVCLLGPSGCGKSTLLNCVAGYVAPSRGTVTVDGEPITKPGPDRGMVFQQYSLFPWKTVLDNVAFGPHVAGKNDSEATARTFLDMVGLSRFAKLSRRVVGRHAAARRHRQGACQLSARHADG